MQQVHRRSASARHFLLLLAFGISPALANHPNDDACPDAHIAGGEDLVPEATVKNTGQPVYDRMIVPNVTWLLFHMRATAFGRCEMFHVNGDQCDAGLVSQRTVHHINLDLTAETTSLNGQYYLGAVTGKNANGTTAYYNVLDTHDTTTSTGPISQLLYGAGMYRYQMTNVINATACNIVPTSVKKYLTVFVRDSSNDENLGCRNENGASVGNPCHVSTGNKYQKEVDRATPVLPFIRHYNSNLIVDFGLGYGWLTAYHRRLELFKTTTSATIRARQGDGYAEPFTRTAGGAWQAESDSSSTLTEDATGYTLSYLTRSQDRYDLLGRLLEATDETGTTTTYSYDAGTGRLLQVSDAYGHTLAFSYDGNGRLASIDAGAGSAIGYEYDVKGNLWRVTYPDASTREYLYEVTARPHHLTGINDANGSRFGTYTYDSGGRVTSSQHSGGAGTVSLVYSTSTSTAVTDALSVARTFTFSKIKGVYRPTAISGSSCSWCELGSATTYDSNGNATSKRDFNGIETRRTYDPARNVETARTEAYGTPRARTISTTWHPTLRFPTQVDEPGKRTTFTYDASGNVLTETTLDLVTSDTRTRTYTHNSQNQLLAADGPRTDVNDLTTYTYHNCATGYHCGQIETITNALGHTTTYSTYNVHGQPLTITDPNGVVTTLAYDLRQRLTSRTVGNEQTPFAYWPTGLLKKATLPDASYLEYTYDAAHRLTGINDSAGNRISYTLDAMGNRTAEQVFDPSNALTQTRTRVFNTLSRLWKEIGAAGTASVTTEFGYDNNGQTTINAPLSRNSTHSYDELNRLKQLTDPLLGNTQYGYNALDQLISVTDPRSKVTSYSYNALGDLTQQVSPDTGTTTNTYDSGGNLSTSTDARSKTATYAYDALNRVTSLSFADQTISYAYDTGTNQKGRLTQLTDASGSTGWSYDPQGRVLSRQQGMGSVTKSVGYAYDASGRLQTLTLPSGHAISYDYSNGKVASLTLNGSTPILSNVLYQPFGPTQGWTWGNATLAVRDYDTDGRITDIDSAGLRAYSYDDAFRITAITDASDPNLSQGYGYDLLDRLMSATGTNLNQGWTYDANGNRLAQTGTQPSTYNVSSTNNRLGSITGTLTRTYGYDASGNTTSDGTATFTYNDAGRMASVTAGGITTNYAINGLGQRVNKTTSGVSTYFVYDEAGHLIGEYDNAGSLIQETVWFGDIPVATLKPNGSGGVNTFYVHADHLNTPRRISRPSDNTVVWRWDSDPFGSTSANEDPDGDSSLFAYNLRLPGQYFDSETGLHHNYFRDYDPATGRYPQSDPIGLRGGINTYAYALNNPITRYDRFGLQTRPRVVPWWWPVIPPRPPGGWSEEEWAKDVWDGLKNIGKAIKDFCTQDEPDCKKARTECTEECMPELGRTNTSFNDCHAKCMDRKGCSGYNPNWKT